MDEIKQWLEGEGDYDAGVGLYAKYCRNRILLQYLMRKKDMQKLRYELEKLSGIKIAVPPAIPADLTVPVLDDLQKPQDRLRIIRDGQINFKMLPEVLQRVYLDACDAYKLMRRFHEKMKLAVTDADRSAARAELIVQDDRHKTCWSAIDRWAADGALPAPVTEPPADISPSTVGPVDGKALGAARVAIGRDLNMLEKTEHPEAKEPLLKKLRANVAVVIAAGCDFGKNAPRLEAAGLIPPVIV